MGEFLHGIPGELDASRGDQWERPFGKGHNDMRETTGQMRTAICYCSLHHGNTKKLLDAIASRHEVTLIDVKKDQRSDLAGYDRIGLASGIYYGKFAKQLIASVSGIFLKVKTFFASESPGIGGRAK